MSGYPTDQNPYGRARPWTKAQREFQKQQGSERRVQSTDGKPRVKTDRCFAEAGIENSYLEKSTCDSLNDVGSASSTQEKFHVKLK